MDVACPGKPCCPLYTEGTHIGNPFFTPFHENEFHGLKQTRLKLTVKSGLLMKVHILNLVTIYFGGA